MIENLLEVGRHFQENSYEREVLEEGVTRLEVQCCGQWVQLLGGAVQLSEGAVYCSGGCSSLQWEGGKTLQ